MEEEYQQHQSLSVSSEDLEAVLKRSNGQTNSHANLEAFTLKLEALCSSLSDVQRDCADHRQRLDRTYRASKVTIDRVEGLKERRTQLQQKQATVSALMAACGLPRTCWAGPVDDTFLDDLEVLFQRKACFEVVDRNKALHGATGGISLAQQVLASHFIEYEAAAATLIEWVRGVCRETPEVACDCVSLQGPPPHPLLLRALRIMAAAQQGRPLLLELINVRRQMLRRDFLKALSETSAKALAFHAYDPKRVAANYLGWLFQALAREESFAEAASRLLMASMTESDMDRIFDGVIESTGSRLSQALQATGSRSEVAFLEIAQIIQLYVSKIKNSGFAFQHEAVIRMLEPHERRMMTLFKRKWQERLDLLQTAPTLDLGSPDVPPIVKQLASVVVSAADAYSLRRSETTDLAVSQMVDESLVPLVNVLRKTTQPSPSDSLEAKRKALIRLVRTFHYIKCNVAGFPVVIDRLRFLDELLNDSVKQLSILETEALLGLVGLVPLLDSLKNHPDSVTAQDIAGGLRHIQMAVVSGSLDSTFTTVSLLPSGSLRSALRSAMTESLLAAYEQLAQAGKARGVATEESAAVWEHLTKSFVM